MPTNVPVTGKLVPYPSGNYYLIDAALCEYDNTTSGLSATNVQAAIDELVASAGTGTVTSVGLSMPAIFSVSIPNPITTSGTFTVTFNAQSPNVVFAGPSGGGSALPTFRALASADIPNIAESQVTGLVSDLATLAAEIAAAGTVTQVTFPTAPSWLTASVATNTTTPAISLTATSGLTANRFLATPNGSTGAVALRAIAGADLPNPSSSSLGGVQSAAAVSHQWIDSISTAGVPHLSQPSFADLSGTASTAQLPTTGLDIDQHYGEIGSVTASAGAAAVNLATNDWWTVNLSHTATTTLSLTSPTVGQQFTLILVQDSSGSNLVSWFSTIKWPGGTVPTLSTGPNAIDVFTFKCYGSGTYYGFTPGLAMA